MSGRGSGGWAVVVCHYCQREVSFIPGGIADPLHVDGSAICSQGNVVRWLETREMPPAVAAHLPECQPGSAPEPPLICICPELRACEERARMDQCDVCCSVIDEKVAAESDAAYRLGKQDAIAGLDAVLEEYVGDMFKQGRTALMVARNYITKWPGASEPRSHR